MDANLWTIEITDGTLRQRVSVDIEGTPLAILADPFSDSTGWLVTDEALYLIATSDNEPPRVIKERAYIGAG